MKILLLFLSVMLISSCGSAKQACVAEEKQEISGMAASDVLEDIETKLLSILESDMEENMTVETTVFDTSRFDSLSGKSPVLSKTKATKSKKKGSKKTSEASKKANISATNEESANLNITTENHREKSVAETKQPLYMSRILLGLAAVVLVGILAYWVFTKYRAEK